MENMGENTMWPQTHEYKDIGSSVFPITQPTVNNEWRNMFRDVRECNAFLENYHDAEETEPGAKERLAAEVRVIRVLNYSFMTSFFGDVPFITVPVELDDSEVYGERTPQSEVLYLLFS